MTVIFEVSDDDAGNVKMPKNSQLTALALFQSGHIALKAAEPERLSVLSFAVVINDTA